MQKNSDHRSKVQNDKFWLTVALMPVVGVIGLVVAGIFKNADTDKK